MLITDALDGQIKCVDACSSAVAGAPNLITAGAGDDNSKVTGQTINRLDSTGKLAMSCVLATHYLAALTDEKTISIAHELQESADGASWDSAEVIEASAVKATSSGGTNERGVDTHVISLKGRKQYIRFNVTVDLNAADTDTATFHSVAVLGGFPVTPVST